MRVPAGQAPVAYPSPKQRKGVYYLYSLCQQDIMTYTSQLLSALLHAAPHVLYTDGCAL